MTGGRAVVLGRTGRNFAAGMSGGVAYVLDEDATFDQRCNMGLVGFDPIEESDAIELHGLIEEHAERTGSPVAERILSELGVVPPAVREGHAARLQARAARAGRGRARVRARGVDRRRGLRGRGVGSLMGKIGAFLDIARVEQPERDPAQRTADYKEFMQTLPVEGLREQGARCMECGVPFCHNGCPLGNLIPDWNDLVYRDRWREAIVQLHATNNFPEFTGKLCPAPCEAACVLEIREGDAVAIKQIEVSIVNRAWDEGWIVPQPPAVETGRTVAVVGSGPAGMAAAQQLRRAGHTVTVYERDEAGGGLVRFGVPHFKIEKWVVERRLAQLEAEGVEFRYGVDVGVDISAEELRAAHDAVVIATGSRVPRDLPVPGPRARRRALRDGVPLRPRARAGRQRAGCTRSPQRASTCSSSAAATPAPTASATPTARARPRSPRSSCSASRPRSAPTTSRPGRAGPSSCARPTRSRRAATATSRSPPPSSPATAASSRSTGSRTPASRRSTPSPAPRRPAPPSSSCWPWASSPRSRSCSRRSASSATQRGNAKAGAYATSADGVFAAGDARRGQSLIVWAINEGRQCARVADRYLRDLPARDPHDEESAGSSERFGSPDLGADPPRTASLS